MKKLSLIAVACFAFMAFQACNDAGSDDPIESANESNEVKQDSADNTGASQPAASTVSEEESKFAVEVASSGMTEVQLGELAQQKASSQKVKDYGAMMVRDHSKANDELKSIAAKKNITLPPAPGEDHMDHIKKLSEKSGKEFDKDYMKMMVDDHKDNIDAFEKCSKDGKDADLKAFADKTLPTLRKHHEEAKKINDALK